MQRYTEDPDEGIRNEITDWRRSIESDSNLDVESKITVKI